MSDRICEIVWGCGGEIGVGVIINKRDRVSVNNKRIYGMMSVFKVDEGLGVWNDFEKKGVWVDRLVKINREKVDGKRWRGMMKDY